MGTVRSAVLIVFLASFLLPFRTLSQSASEDSATDSATSVNPSPSPGHTWQRYHEISLYAGQSFGYPQVLSDLDDQRILLIGVRMTGRLYDFKHLDLRWNADLRPLALYSNDIYGPREYTYGGGTSVGLQLKPHSSWKLQPYFDVDGGFLAFTKNTPLPDTRRVNMSFDFGPGFYIPMGRNRAIKTGVWFFHFSNGFTVKHNPSFDTFVIYTAYTFRNILPPRHPSGKS